MGFEPTDRLHDRRISSPVHSTALPPILILAQSVLIPPGGGRMLHRGRPGPRAAGEGKPSIRRFCYSSAARTSRADMPFLEVSWNPGCNRFSRANRRPSRRPCVAESQNRVLRNTYWLLALSMLPTIAGAWVGHADEFRERCSAASPIMAPLLMFGVMLGALFGVTALRNSAWGVPALFGFTFIAGRDARADPFGRGGLSQRRPARRAGRRDDGGDLLRDGRPSPR